MNNKVHIDAQVLKLLYFKYRAYLLPGIAFVLSWLIFFQFVLPQIQTFLATKDTIIANEQTLAQLSQNYNTISLINDKDLQTLFDTANHALPQTIDFAGILTAISSAAADSGVTVNDYSFQVGNIGNIGKPQGPGNQTVQLSLTINGTTEQLKQFLAALDKKLPLSEVTSINITSDAAAGITASFFYAPFPNTTFIDTNPLPVLSTSQKKILEDLGTNTGGQFSQNTGNIASPSPELIPAVVSSTGAK